MKNALRIAVPSPPVGDGVPDIPASRSGMYAGAFVCPAGPAGFLTRSRNDRTEQLILRRNPYHIVAKELDVPAYRDIAFVLRNKKTASLAVKQFIDYLQFR